MREMIIMGILGTIFNSTRPKEEPVLEDKDLDSYREAFKYFVCAKYAYMIDKGKFDSLIGAFAEGDTLTLNMSIETIPNDIIFMRSLTKKEITPEILEKVHKLWDEQEIKH